VPLTSGAPRFRLRGALEPFFARDGDVYLLRGGSGPEHVVRRPNEQDRRLLLALADGPIAVDPASLAAQRLAPVIAVGAVVPEPAVEALASVDAERFARQLPYFEDFGDPVAAQRMLRRSSVAILGCGGLGTWALGALASAGVGRFVLIDDDVVDLSNLNRQVLYAPRDIGVPKVDRAAAWVEAFDPRIAVQIRRERIHGPSDLDELADCDALLLTADWPPYELARWVNEAALAQDLPFVTAGQQPPVVKIGPTYTPGHGACFACHERALRAEFVLYDELAEQRRRRPPPATTLGPASALIGSLLALEVMHLLLGHRPLATHDRALVIDLRTLETEWERVVRDPHCPVCSASTEPHAA
jgi:bacteriocin biosynthesis cyclodehydratase domain-containing protein